MAQNANNVNIFKPSTSGALSYLILNSLNSGAFDTWLTNAEKTPKTAATIELPSGVKSAGYIGTDGFSFPENSEAGDPVKAFGGDTVVSGTTTTNPQLTFPLWELVGNVDALCLAYNSEDVSDGRVANSGRDPESKILFLDFLGKNNSKIRFVFPSATFSARGDVEIGNEDPYGIEVTYNLNKDSKGYVFYRYNTSI